ncbi:hypothetical protein MAPG_11683 [Magnaporthiopsis poae ATCC 64411]|uniref:Uncharacterized protein n=1 Tax=Magnaporthiopsis poae (strain ATCC 64411 / 73-15) TaxID=644358 RepID=A0A0C4EFX3_MAGP6|nr:hypothetical protein MAPG_11683 [Magnaporthiopsis poae ATCC 64411]
MQFSGQELAKEPSNYWRPKMGHPTAAAGGAPEQADVYVAISSQITASLKGTEPHPIRRKDKTRHLSQRDYAQRNHGPYQNAWVTAAVTGGCEVALDTQKGGFNIT